MMIKAAKLIPIKNTKIIINKYEHSFKTNKSLGVIIKKAKTTMCFLFFIRITKVQKSWIKKFKYCCSYKDDEMFNFKNDILKLDCSDYSDSVNILGLLN